MSTPKKIKIQVRPSPGKLVIRAREKQSYTCMHCANRYLSFYYFCPQCLGQIASTNKELASLKIIAIPPERATDLAQTLKSLAGREDFDFEKAFQTLPWTMIHETDAAVLEEWKQSLEAMKAGVEVAAADSTSKKKSRKTAAPLFSADAPLPLYCPPTLEKGLRAVGAAIQNASIRLQWVETVLAGFQLLERFYKQDPNLRILFPDFLYRIELESGEAVRAFHATRKTDEESFLKVTTKLKGLFHQMETEIQAVTAQIEEQL